MDDAFTLLEAHVAAISQIDYADQVARLSIVFLNGRCVDRKHETV